MIVNVRKCCITGALWIKENDLSLANRTLLASRLQKHFVPINTHISPILSIDPSESYHILWVELNTTLAFTKYWHELRRTTKPLINALSTSLLTQSRRIRVIRGLLIGKHFTFGSASSTILSILEGRICRVLHSAVSSVRNLPRSALHRPTSDLGYGLPSLKARVAQLTVCHMYKNMNTSRYIGHMAITHIHIISTTYNHKPT
jgi:hypothetical protein